MPLDESVTLDKCGNTWNVFGNPVIQNGALYLDGSSYLQMVGGLSLGGEDFTISAQVSLDSTAGSYGVIVELTTSKGTANRLEINRYGTSNQICVWANELWGFSSYADIPAAAFELKIDYKHSDGTVKTYVDGVLKATANCTLADKYFDTVTLGCGTQNTSCWKGILRNFRILSGGSSTTFDDFTQDDIDDIFKP